MMSRSLSLVLAVCPCLFARVLAAELESLSPETWQYAATDGCKGTSASRCGSNEWSKITGFSSCAEVGTQSPINLVPGEAEPQTTNAFAVNPIGGKCETANVEVNPHTVQLNVVAKCMDDYSVTFDSKKYSLHQTHFHSPSEHTLDGKYFPLEAHYVHKDVDSEKLLVLSVLIGVGGDSDSLQDKWLNQLFDLLPALKNPNDNDHTIVQAWKGFNPYDFAPDDFAKSHYEYVGSLTTPPCTHGEQWIVAGKSVHVTQKTLDRYREVINENGNNQLGAFGEILGQSSNTPSFNAAGGDVAWKGDLKCNNRPIRALHGKDGNTRVVYAVGSPTLGEGSAGGGSLLWIVGIICVVAVAVVAGIIYKKKVANGREKYVLLLA